MPLLAPQSPHKAELIDAHRHGRETGSKVKKLGIDCPYGFHPIALRHQWFVGFAEGRAVLRSALVAE